MITEYVLFAVITFLPGTSTQFSDRMLPLKLSFSTADECLNALKMHIDVHRAETGAGEVRRENIQGAVCMPVAISRHYTEQENAAYQKQRMDSIKASLGADDVLDGQ